MKKTALYPGSFNPMHKGHLSIITWLAGSGMFDEVRVMLSPHNPFKTNLPEGIIPEMSEQDIRRLASVRRALERNCPEVILEDIEFSLPLPHYTYNTLQALKSRDGNEYCMVIGADNLAVIDKWYRGADLLAEYEFWVYPRIGEDMEDLIRKITSGRKVKSVNVISAPLVNISSSQIREAQERGDHSFDSYII